MPRLLCMFFSLFLTHCLLHYIYKLTSKWPGQLERSFSLAFDGMMRDLVAMLKSQPPLLHAFRMAARNLALEHDMTTDCLHQVLRLADGEGEEEEGADEESESDDVEQN
jgi:hypothetical protein